MTERHILCQSREERHPKNFGWRSSLSKKSSNSWAFSNLDGIMKEGEERCWNEGKRIENR
jgi:hypothetical protein